MVQEGRRNATSNVRDVGEAVGREAVEFLHEVVPKAGTIALLVDPN